MIRRASRQTAAESAAAIPGLPDLARLARRRDHRVAVPAVAWDRGIRGPLAPVSWLNYARYPVLLLWLVPATIKASRPAGGPRTSGGRS